MSDAGLYEVVLDLKGAVVSIGSRLAALLGAQRDELIGRPIVRLMRGPALTGPTGQALPIELKAEGRSMPGLALRAVEGDRVHITVLPDVPPPSAPAAPRTGRSERPQVREDGLDARIVSDVVRELHDPLTGITGFSTLAQLAATPHRRKYYLDQVTSQAERVRRLAQSLDRAFLARPPLVAPVELGGELGRTVSATRLALERHGIAFDLHASSSVWAACDARQVGDMVVALIHRGTLAQRRDYQANEIALDVTNVAGHAQIELVFTGADQPTLLMRERFGLDDGRGTAPTTPGDLELESAQRALERQGGACRVTADEGAECIRVLITLPAAPTPPRPDPLRTPVPLEILVIDDDAMIGELYSELLGASGHTVTACRSIYAALAALKQQRFDAVVSEFALKDGTLSELWAEAAHAHTALESRLLVVTRDPRDLRLREWAARERTLVLAKPFQPTQLLDQLALLTQ